MKQAFVIFIWVICNVIGISFGEIIHVPIKSHIVLSKDVITNEVKSIYDNNMNTVGSFYYASSKNVEVDFDLGANHIIEKIVATIKSDSPEIGFIVGNLINGQGGLAYICSKKINSYNVYECIPKCRAGDPTRNGIVARKFLMSFLVKSNWASIYEIKVYSKTKDLNSNLISDNRLVLPDDCDEKSWLLTKSLSSKFKSKVQKMRTQIFLEKNYIINEIDVIFQGDAPKILKIQLSNGEKKQVDSEIDITKCTSAESKFTCQLNRLTFPVRVVTITSDEISQLFLRGKTVFYPTLEVTVSKNMKDNLKLTCDINPCDLSVHSNCSENMIKSGVQLTCSNKRLLRMPSESDHNSFVIINQGRVEKLWSRTKFKVESNDVGRMIVSMPRSYQYFGQYQCSCFVTDEPNTEIASKITSLTETDFLENLVFKTNASYKLDENEQGYKKILNNLLLLDQSSLKNTFIVVKLSWYSLISGLVISISVPVSNNDEEIIITDVQTRANIKAFDDNPDSWSVNIYKYEIDESFPEFEHNKGIKINYLSKKYNLTQNSFIQFLKKNNSIPEIIQEITNKLILIKVLYGGKQKIKLTVTEETCTKSETQELAIIHGNNCSTFNAQAVCSNLNDIALVSINKERNTASKYIYSVIETSFNTTLKSILVNNTLVLDGKDIGIKMKYVDINVGLLKSEITKVDVEIKFISKIIDDFLPCGIVSLTVKEPQKVNRKMILQKSAIILTVDLISVSVNVTLTVQIDGINGEYMTMFTVVDPFTFSANNVKIESKPKLSLFWNGINKVANDLLVEYEVSTVTTVIACNLTQNHVSTIKKFENPDNQNKYQTELGSLSEKYSSKLIVYVQPIFKNGKKGQLQKEEKLTNFIKSTIIAIDNNIFPKHRIITLIPSQSNIPCSIKNVTFEVKSSEVDNLIPDISEIGKMKYTINKLVPGRKYTLTAQVHYKFGPADDISEVYIFETADDISISQTKHIVQVNDKVNITCTADVGPMDKFRKTIEWRRADNSPLPEGVSSATYPDIPGSAFLIMDNALADYSGDYGCYVKPAARVGLAKITVIVNDLVVNPDNLKVNFSNSFEPISITCSSSTIGDGNLDWIDSDNLPILEKENDKFKIETIITKEKAIKSVLMIKKPSLITSGTYQCLKSIGEMKAIKKFTLYGEEKIEINVVKISELVGEITKLRCRGQLATKNQKVVWDTKTVIHNGKEIVKTFYPNKTDSSIQDIEIINNLALHQVSCKIVPDDVRKKPISDNFLIKLKPKIQVDGPTNVTVGSSVNFTCIGHPTNSAKTLQWVFYNETMTKTKDGGVIVSSMHQSSVQSYEPIKLILTLENVKNNEAGRYECKFKTELGTEYLTSKSISLSVETSKLTIINPVCLDCSKKSAHKLLSFYLSRSICLSVIVFALFYLL